MHSPLHPCQTAFHRPGHYLGNTDGIMLRWRSDSYNKSMKVAHFVWYLHKAQSWGPQKSSHLLTNCLTAEGLSCYTSASQPYQLTESVCVITYRIKNILFTTALQGKGHKTLLAPQPHQVFHPGRLRNAFHFSMKDLKINQNTAIYHKPALLITESWFKKRLSHALA